MVTIEELRSLLAQGHDGGELMVPVPLSVKNALPALLDVAEAAALYRESVLAKREYSDWTEAMQRWKPAEFDRLVLRMNLKFSRGEALFTALARLGSKEPTRK